MTTRGLAVALAAAVILVGAGGCGSGGDGGEEGAPTSSDEPAVRLRTLVADAASPVAPVAEPDGGLLYGERLTGRIRRVDPEGDLEPDPVATVETSGAEDDQRGLLGLVRLADTDLYASWTRAGDDRLVVGRVEPGGPATVIWVGPPSARLANGGGLAQGPDGSLLVGVGDLQQPGELGDDPARPNRKVLALDPTGAADQVPMVLSSGWNNPYALAVAEDGIPWVADNAPGPGPERMGRADRPAGEAVGLETDGEVLAPSGLVSLGDGRFAMCGFVSQRVDEVEVVGGRARLTGRMIAQPCATGVAVLVDGRVVTATLDAVLVAEGG